MTKLRWSQRLNSLDEKKQKEKLACGKKFHSADERIMKDAEKILFEELALVLEIEPSEVLDFIHNELEAQSAGA
ncbi:MAG: hypothetical protein ACI4F6_02215 [Acutalibacteraceae bacterium]